MPSSSFQCVGCGCCCSVAPFTKNEATLVKEATGYNFYNIVAPDIDFYLPQDVAFLLIKHGVKVPGICDFLYYSTKHGRTMCAIYDMRPGICHQFSNLCPNANNLSIDLMKHVLKRRLELMGRTSDHDIKPTEIKAKLKEWNSKGISFEQALKSALSDHQI